MQLEQWTKLLCFVLSVQNSGTLLPNITRLLATPSGGEIVENFPAAPVAVVEAVPRTVKAEVDGLSAAAHAHALHKASFSFFPQVQQSPSGG